MNIREIMNKMKVLDIYKLNIYQIEISCRR